MKIVVEMESITYKNRSEKILLLCVVEMKLITLEKRFLLTKNKQKKLTH